MPEILERLATIDRLQKQVATANAAMAWHFQNEIAQQYQVIQTIEDEMGVPRGTYSDPQAAISPTTPAPPPPPPAGPSVITSIALNGADVAVGEIPVAGSLYDLSKAISGYNWITGEDESSWAARAANLLSMIPGIGAGAKGVSTTAKFVVDAKKAAGAIAGSASAAKSFTKVDEVADATRKSFVARCTDGGGCFVAGTLVHVVDESDLQFGHEPQLGTDRGMSTAVAESRRTRQIGIELVPLGARVVTENPIREDYDISLPEPEQARWRRVVLEVEKSTGSVVDIELLRPAEWILNQGLLPGSVIPFQSEELQIRGVARVIAIDDCPNLLPGLGSVVTGRIVTRRVDHTVRITLSNGETIEGTAVHPVWSPDRQAWIPLGRLEPGDFVQGDDGWLSVMEVELHDESVPVYNLEVHGEHVYQIGQAGVLVHNAYGADGVPKGSGGPYGHLPDSSFVGSGKAFTAAQKRKILEENGRRNGGIYLDDVTGEAGVPPVMSTKGVTPPDNELHIDHYFPKSAGGPNSFANAAVRLRIHNLAKSDTIPGE